MTEMESGKKKMETAPKIFIGCGVLLVILVLLVYFGSMHFCKKAGFDAGLLSRNPGLAAAKMIVTANPELELVKVNEKAETITIRNKQSGEEITVDFKDAEAGRIVFKGKDSEVTFSGDEKGLSVEGEDGEMTLQGDQEGFQLKFDDDQGEQHAVDLGGSADASRIPDWVPRWPGQMQVIYLSSSQNQESGSFTIESDENPEEVLSLVRKQLESQGFEISLNSMQLEDGTVHILVGTSETPNRTVTVQIGLDEGGRKVAVSFTQGSAQ